jgi:hypothetical protein
MTNKRDNISDILAFINIACEIHQFSLIGFVFNDFSSVFETDVVFHEVSSKMPSLSDIEKSLDELEFLTTNFNQPNAYDQLETRDEVMKLINDPKNISGLYVSYGGVFSRNNNTVGMTFKNVFEL